MSFKEGRDMVGFVGLAGMRRKIKGASPPNFTSSLPIHKHSLTGSGCDKPGIACGHLEAQP